MTTFATTSAMDFHRLQFWQASANGSDRPLFRGVSNRTDGSIVDGIASCAFVTTKRHLPAFGWEDKSVRNSQTFSMTMKDSGNKDQIVKLRVSGAERDMFEAKAANYGSISAMIRDAVAHYDDTLMKRRIESMNLLYPLISKHESDLNRIGNNLNQIAHYCNLLAANGEYNMQVITSSVEPLLHQLLSLNSDIAATEHKIFTRIFSEKPV